MKKLALVIGLFIFASEGKAQFAFLDSAAKQDFINAPIEEAKADFPNLIIEDKRTFDSLRTQIHISGVKYRFIEFDSLEIASKETIFDKNGDLPRLGVEPGSESQFTLVDQEGRALRMIYLDPKI